MQMTTGKIVLKIPVLVVIIVSSSLCSAQLSLNDMIQTCFPCIVIFFPTEHCLVNAALVDAGTRCQETEFLIMQDCLHVVCILCTINRKRTNNTK